MIRHITYSARVAALAALFCLPAALAAQNGFVRSIPLNPFQADIQPVPATGGYLLASRFYDSLTPTMVFMELDNFGRTQAVHGHTSTEELEISSLVPLAGGNYAGVGSGTDPLGGAALSLLVSPQGQVSQPRMLNDGGFFSWSKAVALPDSGFAAIGSGIVLTGDFYSTIARFDRQGDTVWTRKVFHASESLEFTGLSLLPGGDLMAIGAYYDNVNAISSLLTVRFTPNGHIRWAKQCTFPLSIYPSDLTIIGTKLFTALNTEDASGNAYNMGIAALDTAGNVSWATQLGGFNDAGAYKVRLTSGGNPLLLGYYDTSVGYNASLAELDASTGNLIWARGYDLNGEAEMYQALPLSGGRYLLMAEEFTSADPIHLIETLQDGLVPGPCASVTPAFQPAPLTCTSQSLSLSVRAGMAVVIPALGTSTPNVDNILNCEPVSVDPASALLPVQVLPHPMQTSARVLLPADLDWTGAVIQVTDMGGRSVDMSATPTREGFELHRNGLPAGLYAYQLLLGGRRVAAGKLVLQDGF